MDSSRELCRIAKGIIQDFFTIYLEDRDLEKIKHMLHSEITWIGLGKLKICRGYEEVLGLLNTEKKAWNGSFHILDLQLETLPIGEDCCTVCGCMELREGGESTANPLEIKIRFSAIFKSEGGAPKLYHIHFSVYDRKAGDHNILAEPRLQERTHRLKRMTEELESITNNMLGGIQIVFCEAQFPIAYASEGFYRLCGYSRKELKDFFGNCHLPLVYEPDRAAAEQSVRNLTKIGERFSLEYRICHKDGRLLWVLDKGIRLPPRDGKVRVQSVLTDITAQKEQEEALRISEKRYITALKLSEAVIFEYDIQKKQLIFFDKVADMYGIPNVVENGVETFVSRGIIEPATAEEYQAMYQKIISGEPFAQCYISSRDKDGIVHDYQLSLATIYDDEGRPVRAVGVRKDVAQLLELQKERAYGETMAACKRFLCEADLSADQVLQTSDWLRKDQDIEQEISYSELSDKMVRNSICPEDQEEASRCLSAAYVSAQFACGISLYAFSCRWSRDGEYRWYECTVNVIRDLRSGNLHMRFYHQNIHDRKLKEQRALEERQLYENMVAKASIAYEFNLSANQMLKGHEDWEALFGIKPSGNYTEMIETFAQRGVHPENSAAFARCFDRERVLECFGAGQRQIPFEYRRLGLDKEHCWASCTFHLYADPVSGAVKGFAYVEDINEHKQAELALLYDARHDQMTGFLNKSAAAAEIGAFLNSPEAAEGHYAFFMVDIDHFKLVNDTFGHPYGDKVLSETAQRLRAVFRDGDILGRIGGDEFCVLMKKIANDSAACGKAGELCRGLRHFYSQDGKEVTVSASIGIAVFDRQGISFESLFEWADQALYTAKKNGRDQFYLFLEQG